MGSGAARYLTCITVFGACGGSPGPASKQPVADVACVEYAKTHNGEVPDIPLRPLAEPKPLELTPQVFNQQRRSRTGNIIVAPDDESKIWMTIHEFRKLGAAFRMCVDARGIPTAVDTIIQSCMPRWDVMLVGEMMKWRYEPYLSDGVAVPVCSAVRYLYTQK